MGLLDDAIREHLDLKRRRGADPTEVERAEREALGPVRRAPERVPGDDTEFEADMAPEAGPEHDVAHDDELVYDEQPTGAHELEDAPGADDRATTHTPVDEDEPSWSYDASKPEPPVAGEPAPAVAPALAEPDPAPQPAHGYADHTAAYDAEEAFGNPPEQEHGAAGHPPELEPEDTAEHPAPTSSDEDVLEETPEFLQDTPDHDRLWFEQRPPRDFDFDR